MAERAPHDNQFRVPPEVEIKTAKAVCVHITSRNGAVEKAAELQLLPVITDGHFRPNDAITREEMASILAVVLKSEASALPTVNADLQELFADYKEMDTRLSEDIRIVYQTGVMIGKGGEHFGFKETATRAEAVTVQLRLLKMLGMIDS